MESRQSRNRRGRLAFSLLYVAVFTSSWTGVAFHGYKPVDIALALAILLSGPSLAHTWLVTPWIWAGTGAVILVAVIQLWLPTSPVYLQSRYLLPDLVHGASSSGTTAGSSGAIIAAQWLVALYFLPWVGASLCAGSSVLVNRLLKGWMLGAAASGVVATTDFLGITHVGSTLTGYISITDRQSGLASHVNNLGFASVMAVPIALSLVRTRPALAWTSFACLVSGILLSGSRGAQVGSLVVLILTAIHSPSTRRPITRLAYACLLGGIIVAFVKPKLVAGLDFVRFTNQDASASDSERSRVAAQAYSDVRHNPVWGVGYEVLVQAHSIYLEMVAAGGVVLLVGLILYWLGAMSVVRKLRDHDSWVTARYVLVSTQVWLVMGLIQNQLTDRYLYVPIMALAALSVRSDMLPESVSKRPTREPLAKQSIDRQP